jgi:hypothetical protein
MIDEAMEYIRREIRDYLGVADNEASVGHIHELKDTLTTPGLRIGLVNLSEESALRNSSHVVRNNAGQVEYKEPPVYVNCWLLFGFDFSDYGTSLLRLSQTVEHFQNKRFFDQNNEGVGNPFPATIERLIFDMHSADFEQLNHLWGIMGGTYFPSVMYKMRLLRVQADVTVSGPEITHLEVNTRFKAQ